MKNSSIPTYITIKCVIKKDHHSFYNLPHHLHQQPSNCCMRISNPVNNASGTCATQQAKSFKCQSQMHLIVLANAIIKLAHLYIGT